VRGERWIDLQQLHHGSSWNRWFDQFTGADRNSGAQFDAYFEPDTRTNSKRFTDRDAERANPDTHTKGDKNAHADRQYNPYVEADRKRDADADIKRDADTYPQRDADADVEQNA
jgi:hypothetical protein